MEKAKKKVVFAANFNNQLGAPFQYPESDPQGSYTGVPAEPYEMPVQDSDDL